MAVAWLGNREATLEQAVVRAAEMLLASRCPVISLDTDIHGTRAAIALAERIGAAYDLAEPATMREAALISATGQMTVAPGEARRRADMLIQVGDMPAYADDFLRELAASAPDLSSSKKRTLFVLGSESTKAFGGRKATILSCGKTGIAGTLAALRTQLAGRPISKQVANFAPLAAALERATFPVLLFSGAAADPLALAMLQCLVADLNKTKRASSLHVPASENGWGSVLASGWMTGFPPRTSFARGFPEHDPWRFDIARMIADGEADLLLQIGNLPSPLPGDARRGGASKSTDQITQIALSTVTQAAPRAAITFATGTPGTDHDSVRFSARTGTLIAQNSKNPSGPAAATILRGIERRLSAKAVV